jgi:hypothetical protein
MASQALSKTCWLAECWTVHSLLAVRSSTRTMRRSHTSVHTSTEPALTSPLDLPAAITFSSSSRNSRCASRLLESSSPVKSVLNTSLMRGGLRCARSCQAAATWNRLS